MRTFFIDYYDVNKGARSAPYLYFKRLSFRFLQLAVGYATRTFLLILLRFFSGTHNVLRLGIIPKAASLSQ
ncbi:hypothetical protein VZ94_16380 [Methylocucumis oryzae]|uniref:Uncharacterized protein n=1 Tax=Methylocucumis oryzae TaxID=1632867 RepID=A0A0F3IJG1_9GAMM|nr:hypothetical protein VZ94_16380 [Methylocucumis oryzae]